ncbi:MAG: HAD family hydrolase [Candidatus Diapherotrites archaeon]|jgi:putative hydrolase of the HAD superfamily|uniref:HAD family hydrolase n=1 Tax=Candidatus Iainarchaeum sp. TaxID=3101447 RepID=A0A8T5GDV3_9ARCH|nr:HAD family hydrolase [Candidatus Diapherotrites archaeon]MBT7240904.1 HAD family hydrolase [Candidatus Diapherotrites archaeon]
MVLALFFDLTDTLQDFDWNKQWNLLQEVIMKEAGDEVPIELLKKYYQQTYDFYRIGKIKNDFEFFDLIFRQLAMNISNKQIEKIVDRHLEIRKEFTSLPEKYDKTLIELAKHFKLAIVSSGVWPWGDYDFEKIFCFPMKKHFDLIVNSYEEGYLKDSGKLFDIALEKMGFDAKEVAYVGNSYEKDVLLAKQYGMKTIFLNKKNESLQGDITITKLSDLVEIIDQVKLI